MAGFQAGFYFCRAFVDHFHVADPRATSGAGAPPGLADPPPGAQLGGVAFVQALALA